MTKVTGPKDGDLIVATFIDKTGVKSKFPSLRDTKDLVLLSIAGNPHCTGKYLGAIINKAVESHRPKQNQPEAKGMTTILIADELYWHNLKPLDCNNADELRLKQEALALGEKYFEENLEHFLDPLGVSADEFRKIHPAASMDQKIAIINKLALDHNIKFEIVRWGTWIKRDTEGQLQEIQPLYQSVPGLKVGIEKEVAKFVERHELGTDAKELLEYRSRDYLTEESPAIIWLAAYLGYNFIIYPGDILASFQATIDYFVLKKHSPFISEGVSMSDECKHDQHAIHLQKPELAVNWMDINFKKSYSNKPEPANKTENKTGRIGGASSLGLFSSKSLEKERESEITPLRSLAENIAYRVETASPIMPLIDSKSITYETQAMLRPNVKSIEQIESVGREATESHFIQALKGMTTAILESPIPMEERLFLLTGILAKFCGCDVEYECSAKDRLSDANRDAATHKLSMC